MPAWSESLKRVNAHLDEIQLRQEDRHYLLLEALMSAGADTSIAIRESKEQSSAQTDQIIRSINARADDILAASNAGNAPATVRKKPSGIHALVKAGDFDAVKRLVKQDPAAVNETRENDQRTALHVAAELSNHEIVSYLLKQGADPNREDLDDSTPLHLATKVQSARSVRALRAYGADVNAKDSILKTPLDYATNKTEVSWILRNGPDMEATNAKGETAVEHFVKNNKPMIVESLLDQGAAAVTHGSTQLHIAAAQGFVDVAKTLIQHGSPVDRYNGELQTPLHVAAVNARIRVVEVLTHSNADIDKRAPLSGRTALLEALIKGRVHVALALIRDGASVDFGSKDGLTPLQVACREGLTDVVPALLRASPDSIHRRGQQRYSPIADAAARGHAQIVRVLLAAGADTDDRCLDGLRAPLHMAAMHGHAEVVGLLIDEGHADIEARDAEGRTPLIEATIARHASTVSALLVRGANADAAAQADRLHTSLHIAAAKGEARLIQLLVEEGHANVNTRAGRIGPTPLILAVTEGTTDAVRTLLAAGADANMTSRHPASMTSVGVQSARVPPVSLAVLKHAYAALEALVETGGADVNCGDSHGCTPLHHAVRCDDIRALRYLVQHGANRELRGQAYGRLGQPITPLEYARKSDTGHRAAMCEILSSGSVDAI